MILFVTLFNAVNIGKMTGGSDLLLLMYSELTSRCAMQKIWIVYS